MCYYAGAECHYFSNLFFFRSVYYACIGKRRSPVIPNIKDPQGVDAQTVCPGYIASNVQQTDSGFKASLALAGPGCNVYGTDIEALNLIVEYQNAHRLHVAIVPAYIATENATQYIIPESVLTRPGIEQADVISDLEFSWTNEPSFGFDVTRKSNKDVLFSTKGAKLVFENQFVEFKSSLPENYNLYGLGESIHAFRLGNNYTKTYYAADVGASVDIYVKHPMMSPNLANTYTATFTAHIPFSWRPVTLRQMLKAISRWSHPMRLPSMQTAHLSLTECTLATPMDRISSCSKTASLPVLLVAVLISTSSQAPVNQR